MPVTLRDLDVDREPPPEIVDILPTPLEMSNGRKPIVIEPLDSGVRQRSMWTLWQFAKFLGLGWWRSVTRKSSAHEKAVLLRELFERLSGMWIKLGQLMSLRTDILSIETCQELSKLQFEVRGFSPEVSRRVVEEDLGQPISSVFSQFETHPFAAATVAQVHRATLLRNNRAVVVKVMRPDVAASFERDLRLLHRIVRVTSFFGIWKRLRLKEAVRELRDVLLEETNYEQEALNLRTMRKSLRRHSIYVPRVISRLSKKRVLVMEEVPGVLMSTYIRVRNRGARAGACLGTAQRHRGQGGRQAPRAQHAAADPRGQPVPRRPASRQHRHAGRQRARPDRFRQRRPARSPDVDAVSREPGGAGDEGLRPRRRHHADDVADRLDGQHRATAPRHVGGAAPLGARGAVQRRLLRRPLDGGDVAEGLQDHGQSRGAADLGHHAGRPLAQHPRRLDPDAVAGRQFLEARARLFQGPHPPLDVGARTDRAAPPRS